MFGFMAGEIMVQAVVLSLILYFVARHEADYSIAKVSMVVAGITLGTFLISALAGPHIGKFTILANLAFICFMLMTFCWVTLWKSIFVVAIYSCFYVAMFFVGQSIKSRISKSMNPTLIEQRAQDIDEIKQELLRQQQMFAVAPGIAPPSEPAQDPTNRPAITSSPGGAEAGNTGLQEAVAGVSPAQAAPTPQPSPVAVTVAHGPPAPAEDAIWGEARKKLKIGGAITGANGKWTAFVNNKLVEVGDMVSARYEKTTYRWTVRTISREGLTFDPVDREPQK